MDEPAKLQTARLPCTETPALLMITINFRDNEDDPRYETGRIPCIVVMSQSFGHGNIRVSTSGQLVREIRGFDSFLYSNFAHCCKK